jgi:nucleotide-binding universal stress UspA family protein
MPYEKLRCDRGEYVLYRLTELCVTGVLMQTTAVRCRTPQRRVEMYQRILVPVDGSDTSNRGLQEAIKLAQALNAELKLVHVVNEFYAPGGVEVYYDLPTAMDSLREAGKQALAKGEKTAQDAGVKASADLIEAMGARAADRIVDAANRWPADLIIMGTHGRRGFERFALGSDAETVLRASTVPVLLIRAPR